MNILGRAEGGELAQDMAADSDEEALRGAFHCSLLGTFNILYHSDKN